MNSKRFNEVFNEQHENRKSILCGKAEEYASDGDRLHNFKVAAAVQEITPLQALAGMMAKHTVSVYDMLWSGKKYPLELWREKITDSQNYLDLAWALINEQEDEMCEKYEKKLNALNERAEEIYSELDELFNRFDISEDEYKELKDKFING